MKGIFERTEDGTWRAHVTLRGRALHRDSLLNKGTSFSHEERRTFQLEGLLPGAVRPLEVQAENAFRRVMALDRPLNRFVALASLQERNEVLFHKMLFDNVEDLLPVVYTPTVGLAAEHYSRIFRRARALWITPDMQGRIREVLEAAAPNDVKLIVVTDNERILGLGDQGAGGIVIPIGKLALYTAGAGIHPAYTLPVSLDVGTDNEGLLNDPAYVGWRHPRLRGDRYEAIVEEFVDSVKAVFPRVLLQWEDFKKGNAFDLLERYRHRLLSFNDDIQGTAAVAAAGVVAACRAKGEPLRDQRIVMLGAGAAGIGIVELLRGAMARDGLEGDDLTRAIAALDSQGMLLASREYRDAYKKDFAWPDALARAEGLSTDAIPQLADVVKALRPTMLIGTSGQPGVFDEPLVREMAKHCERPAFFPFSNPTSKSEAVPADVLRWTDGRALVATGSPFDPVHLGGRTHRIGQGNNVFIFPGVGLGALVAGAREVTDAMFTVAATALAEKVGDDDLAEGALYPRLRRLREISRDIAVEVAREAIRNGNCTDGLAAGDVEAEVDRWIWVPAYPELVPA